MNEQLKKKKRAGTVDFKQESYPCFSVKRQTHNHTQVSTEPKSFHVFHDAETDDMSSFDDEEYDDYYQAIKSASSKKQQRMASSGAKSAGKRTSTGKRAAR